MNKVLQINSSFEPMAFIGQDRALKLFFSGKVEIISEWDAKLSWSNGSMNYPAVIKMKYYVRKPMGRMRFNRKSVFRRDFFTCQYCGETQHHTKLTIDHILPVAQGGISSWLNCVSSCRSCNSRKGNNTPEQVGMVLLNKPSEPSYLTGLANEYIFSTPKHEEWDYFFQNLVPHGKYLK